MDLREFVRCVCFHVPQTQLNLSSSIKSHILDPLYLWSVVCLPDSDCCSQVQYNFRDCMDPQVREHAFGLHLR